MAKKIIRLTEEQLIRLVSKINESTGDSDKICFKDQLDDLFLTKKINENYLDSLHNKHQTYGWYIMYKNGEYSLFRYAGGGYYDNAEFYQVISSTYNRLKLPQVPEEFCSNPIKIELDKAFNAR